MWLPAFDAAAKQAALEGDRLDEVGLPGRQHHRVQFRSSNRTYTECDSWRIATLRRIAALKPDLVFVSDSENVVGATVSPAAMERCHAADDERRAREFGRQGRSCCRTCRCRAVRCRPVSRRTLTDVTACTFALTKAYSFPTRHTRVGRPTRLAAGYQVVDPAPWICTTTRCPAIVGERPRLPRRHRSDRDLQRVARAATSCRCSREGGVVTRC